MKFVVQNELEFAKKILAVVDESDGKRLRLALSGELGAGKTTLVKNIGRLLGVTGITSPTFNLRKNYPIKFNNFRSLQHIDLYRLGNLSETNEREINEWLEEDGLTFVEWPERINDFEKKFDILISIKIIDRSKREVELK